MITLDDVKNKTPKLEDFLTEIARELGAKSVVRFDGSEVELATYQTESFSNT